MFPNQIYTCSVAATGFVCTLQEAICWKRVQQLMEENVTVISKVVQINKGGVMVEVEQLRGFVPLSQLPNSNVGCLLACTMPHSTM